MCARYFFPLLYYSRKDEYGRHHVRPSVKTIKEFELRDTYPRVLMSPMSFNVFFATRGRLVPGVC